MIIESHHPSISVRRQCELLGLSRSSNYYRSQRKNWQDDLALKKLIDEQYTEDPAYGTRRMTRWLRRQGHRINRKRVIRLMRELGLAGIAPKKNLSKPHPAHKIYPYLLRHLPVTRPDQVWCSDITYIRLKGGFVYLTVVMDWYSRYILSWELSNTLDAGFCVSALQRALATRNRPDIFNTDQGSQYTSSAFTGILLDNDIRISMDGRGRAFDNIFVERFWRTLKYEHIFLHDFTSVSEARQSIGEWIQKYNEKRLHSSLDYRPPAEIYFNLPDPVDQFGSEHCA